MYHALVPLASVLLALGAICACAGWAIDNYVDSISSRIIRPIMWFGLAALAAGLLALFWPFFASFLFARPA